MVSVFFRDFFFKAELTDWILMPDASTWISKSISLLGGGKKTLPEKYPLDGSLELLYRSGPKTASGTITFLVELNNPIGYKCD
jgi:hypothetical protein